VILDDKGEVLKFEGYACKEGEEYAEIEVKAPMRMFTATVIVESEIRPLLPVRVNKPIPKEKLKGCMKVLAGVRAKPPIKLGEVIVPNILKTAADIIATTDLPR
jgi:CxxC motif-containing protein